MLSAAVVEHTAPQQAESICNLVMQVQLSTYGDSLGKNLKDLKHFIDNNLQGAPVAYI